MNKSYQLLTPASDNPKTAKGLAYGYYTVILHLMPFNYSGYQVCPEARGCELTCLAFSGRGPMTNVVQARLRRTRLFFENRALFMRMLVADLHRARTEAYVREMQLVVRLNGTSDLPWEKIRAGQHRSVMAMFPEEQFMDYTKVPGRTTPSNYHLTFSYDGTNTEASRQWLEVGGSVAVIDPTGAEFPGVPIIDGDAHDLRFLDPAPCIVGLKTKRTRLPEQLNQVA